MPRKPSTVTALSLDLQQVLGGLYQSGSIVAFTNAGGRIVDVNDKFVEVSGFTRDELIGADHNIVNSGYHPNCFFIDMWKTIATGTVWHGEIQNKKKNGDLYWLDTRIIPITKENNRIEGYLSIRWEITQAKKQQELLAIKERESTDSERLKTIAFMVRGLAHEVNNPLAIILGNTEILIDRCKNLATDYDKTFFEKRLSRISDSSERVAKIVSSMLKMDNDGTTKSGTFFSLKEALETVSNMTGSRFEKRDSTISFNVSCTRCSLSGHIADFVYIVTELIINASGHRCAGKKLDVSIEASDTENNITVKILDNGSGIPKEIEKSIFTPFFTTKEIGGGLGLGLSVCYELARKNRGALKLTSNVNPTCFELSWPFAEVIAKAS